MAKKKVARRPAPQAETDKVQTSADVPAKKPTPPRKPSPLTAPVLRPKTAAPVKDLEVHSLDDMFDNPVAFRFAFIGVGQAGGRMVETFYRCGYQRVVAINTAASDLEDLDDTLVKLDFGYGGAGKDPERAREIAEIEQERIWDALTEGLGRDFDYLIVCAGLGGGTGSGCSPVVVDVARKYAETYGSKNCKVGAVISMPSQNEGPAVCTNAVNSFRDLFDQDPELTPMIIIDNGRISEIYKPSLRDKFPVANQETVNMLHLFNQLAAQKSNIITFDRADFATILNSGLITFSAADLSACDTPGKLNSMIREQMESSVLADVDVSTGSVAGCIFLCGTNVTSTYPDSFFDSGFEMMTRLLEEDSMVHRGVYEIPEEDNLPNALISYTIIGGLQAPVECIEKLSSQGTMKVRGLDVVQFLGLTEVDD